MFLKNKACRAAVFPAAGFIVVALFAASVVASVHSQQDPPPAEAKGAGDTKVVNAEAAKLKNPEALSPESIAAGEKLYQQHCSGCHGKSGKGDGGQSLGGGDASDFTDDRWDYGATDGEIYWVIREGIPASADMLDYKNVINEKETWQLVNFLRSIGPKKK